MHNVIVIWKHFRAKNIVWWYLAEAAALYLGNCCTCVVTTNFSMYIFVSKTPRFMCVESFHVPLFRLRLSPVSRTFVCHGQVVKHIVQIRQIDFKFPPDRFWCGVQIINVRVRVFAVYDECRRCTRVFFVCVIVFEHAANDVHKPQERVFRSAFDCGLI